MTRSLKGCKSQEPCNKHVQERASFEGSQLKTVDEE